MKLDVMLYYFAAACFYASAIINFIFSDDNAMGVVWLCLGSAMLCFGSVQFNKLKNSNDEKQEMSDTFSYTFKLEKNIHMYYHSLTIIKGKQSYEAIVESAPTKEETILFRLEDFGLPAEDIEPVKDELTKWFAMQDIKCIFEDGKGR